MNIPKLRFKGFNDEWKEEKIGNIACFKRGPFGSALKKSLFSPNGKYVVYEQQNAIYKNSNTRYRIDEHLYKSLEKFSVKNNDILMSGAGTIGAMYQLKEPFNKGVINQAVIRIRLNNSTDDKYFIQYFSCSLGLKILTGKNAGSALKNLIPIKELKNSIINIPLLPEQQKIGALFAKLDNLIDLQAKKLELLKQLKQGLLQKLFPQNNQTTPQLRFKGFNEEWCKKYLKDIGNTYTGLTGKTKEDFGHGKAHFITFLNVLTNPITDKNMLDKIEIDNKQHQVKQGDVFFNTSSETPEEVGMSSVWDFTDDNIYLNSFCFAYRPFIKFNNYFLAYNLRSPLMRKKIRLLAQGISRYNISKNKLMEKTIYYPSLSEQQQIGSLFNKVDNLLTKTQEKITLFKQVKKYLLQQMFI